MPVPQRADSFFWRKPNPSFPRIGLTSKLRFDRRLVDHRPDLHNSSVAEPVKDVLGKNDPPAVHRKAEKEALRPAVEPEPARDGRRVGDSAFGHRATLVSARQNIRDDLHWLRRRFSHPDYVYMHAWQGQPARDCL